jgi:hypothetical protein
VKVGHVAPFACSARFLVNVQDFTLNAFRTLGASAADSKTASAGSSVRFYRQSIRPC